MENLNLDIINEMLEVESNEGWKIDNDILAEWAGNKIREETAEAQRIINVCNTMINEYKAKIENEKKKLNYKISFFEHHLKLYFEKVDKKENKAKTKLTYKLPSITLEEKKKEPEYKRDDKIIVEWLKENNLQELIKIEESAKWSDLKKQIKISGHNAVDENGEVIPGIEIIPKETEFIIKI